MSWVWTSGVRPYEAGRGVSSTEGDLGYTLVYSKRSRVFPPEDTSMTGTTQGIRRHRVRRRLGPDGSGQNTRRTGT